MSDQIDVKERRSALDEFATAAPLMAGQQMVAPQQRTPLPAIYGAQKIAGLPRDESRILIKIAALAAAAGEGWYYRFPVRNKKTGQTDWIEGPSIKLTNDVARLYGNCEVDCREQDMGSSFLFYARFVDLETGYALTRPFTQPKSGAKLGGADIERRDNMSEQIGVSKAQRNVVSNALQTFVDFAFEEAKKAIVDKIGKNLGYYRDKMIERLDANHFELKRVEAVIGRPVNEWLNTDVAKVIAMVKSVNDGMANYDETFPPLGGKAVEQRTTAADLDAYAQTESAGSNTPADSEAAGGSPTHTQPPAALLDMIDKMLQLATDPDAGTVDERLETIDSLGPAYEQQPGMLPEFVKTLLATAGKVARGELTKAKAKDYLAGLIG